MTQKIPASRPALRKSVDATVHPALAGRSGTAPKPAPGTSSGTPGSGLSGGSAGSGPRPLGKAGRAATSDVLRPSKSDPAVTVTVTMPKSVRKKLRAMAKDQRIDAEALAARLIADGLRLG